MELYENMITKQLTAHLVPTSVCDLIQKLKKNQVRLMIATATDAEMAKSALIRNGIWKDFDGMITCEEAGAGKTSPKVFELARERLQTKKEETWVFEDSLYAVKTASEAGFPVCSIYDAYSRDNTEESSSPVKLP